MKKLICVAVVAVLVFVIPSHMTIQAEPGNTLRVPQDYSTIQAAVDAASAGDTVLVADGKITVNGATITYVDAANPATSFVVGDKYEYYIKPQRYEERTGKTNEVKEGHLSLDPVPTP